MGDLFQFPAKPRCYIGDTEILPKIRMDNEVVSGLWVLPGCRVRTTKQVRKIAADNNLPFLITE